VAPYHTQEHKPHAATTASWLMQCSTQNNDETAQSIKSWDL